MMLVLCLLPAMLLQSCDMDDDSKKLSTDEKIVGYWIRQEHVNNPFINTTQGGVESSQGYQFVGNGEVRVFTVSHYSSYGFFGTGSTWELLTSNNGKGFYMDSDYRTKNYIISNNTITISPLNDPVMMVISSDDRMIASSADGWSEGVYVRVPKKGVGLDGNSKSVSSVSLNKKSLQMKTDETEILIATVYPNDASVRDVKWESSDYNIATVSYDGTITGISDGQCEITVTTLDGSKKASCSVKVIALSGIEEGYEWVDLGLSVKWAKQNLGAWSETSYGDYYAWGETSTKSKYTWNNYYFQISGDSYNNVTLSKYVTDSQYGTVDNITELLYSHDAAFMRLGGKWRIPSYSQWIELYNNCTWKWYESGNSEFRGVAGYKVQSKKSGYTDQYIFLPAAGSYSPSLSDDGSEGDYWSRSLDDNYTYDANLFSFDSESYSPYYRGRRCYGRSIRPVCE